MPRPTCAPPVLSVPLFLESVYEKNQEYRHSFKQFRSVRPDLGPHCLQTKNDRDDAPPIRWRKSLELHMNGTRVSSQGVQVHWQLYDLLTVTDIWRRNHDFKSHTIDWWRKGKFWPCFFKSYLVFHFPKVQGVQHILSKEGGGGGASNFFPRGWSPIAKR